jgi:hypothetical protein
LFTLLVALQQHSVLLRTPPPLIELIHVRHLQALQVQIEKARASALEVPPAPLEIAPQRGTYTPRQGVFTPGQGKFAPQQKLERTGSANIPEGHPRALTVRTGKSESHPEVVPAELGSTSVGSTGGESREKPKPELVLDLTETTAGKRELTASKSGSTTPKYLSITYPKSPKEAGLVAENEKLRRRLAQMEKKEREQEGERARLRAEIESEVVTARAAAAAQAEADIEAEESAEAATFLQLAAENKLYKARVRAATDVSAGGVEVEELALELEAVKSATADRLVQEKTEQQFDWGVGGLWFHSSTSTRAHLLIENQLMAAENLVLRRKLREVEECTNTCVLLALDSEIQAAKADAADRLVQVRHPDRVIFRV